MAEAAVRIDGVPNRQELAEARIAFSQRVRGLVVQHAPVRSTVQVFHHRFHRTEVLLIRLPPEHVDREVGGVAPRSGGQRDVVGGGAAHLHREGHLKVIVLDDPPDAGQRGGSTR